MNPFEAYIRALKCDPVSSFGGIVAFNKEVDIATATELNKIFLEIICAPSFSDGALEILKKKKDRRLVLQKKSVLTEGKTFRSIPGGVLAQDSDSVSLNENELKFQLGQKIYLKLKQLYI
jgi:phosphoribosylaminoimidazolecarboxamide formyltransferase/IMP cyclohydrolase